MLCAALDVLHFHKYILNVGTRRKRNHPLRANGCERIRYYDLAQDAQWLSCHEVAENWHFLQYKLVVYLAKWIYYYLN